MPPEPFDVVLAATAFHWIDPAVRVVKAAEALRPGGALATVATHVAGGRDDAFFAEVQACCEALGLTPRPAATRSSRPPTSQLQRGARPLSPVRPRGRAPPRVGAGPHDQRLHLTSCSPSPATGPSTPRPRPACSAASPT